MTPTTYVHKQGDTFTWAGFLMITDDGVPVVDVPAAASQVRTLVGGRLVATLDVTVGSPTPDGFPITLAAQHTDQWPPGELCFDVQLTFPGNVVRSSDTVAFTCARDVTQ